MKKGEKHAGLGLGQQINGFGPAFLHTHAEGWQNAKQSLTPELVDWLDGLIGLGGFLLVVSGQPFVVAIPVLVLWVTTRL
jgi:predicted ATP-grasp superfamily ATP-dependent carboligase